LQIDTKRKNISELLNYIEQRLTELQEEKEELKSFQDHDRRRRCLEYTIYSREQKDITEALEAVSILTIWRTTDFIRSFPILILIVFPT
jgi:structural maintenance of chromosome 3 (chondroitin sulfate proteoglycan 6)